MSYIEKAFWDYLKSSIFSGIRILVSRRFILFSVILFIISILTTGVVVLQDQNIPIISTLPMEAIFLLQISIAIGFIIAGLFSKKLNVFFRLLLLFITVIIVQILYYVSLAEDSLNVITDVLVQLFPLMSFLAWAFLGPLASFAFAKGMLGNKITGTVLFLGKPQAERKSIFSGLFALIAFISFIWNIFMIYIGFVDNRLSYVILGVTGSVIAILIISIVRGHIYSDDVFNTIIGFFFIINLPNQIMIFLTSVTGSEGVVTSFDYLFVIVSLIYSAQNISRRVKMKGVVPDTGKKKVKEDPFHIGRFIGFVGGEGVVLIYLGLYLGFHLIQLQVLSGMATFYEKVFGELTLSEVYHDLNLLFVTIILVVVMLAYMLQRGRGYWESDIYRFDFLPPYEDLVDYIERVKRGEITKTDIALSVGKKAVAASGMGIFAAARKFKDMIVKGKQEGDR
ncbi:MAG: hypothetical protein ACTSW1_16880 [Candidatus Hodarchaeales archaeon]